MLSWAGKRPPQPGASAPVHPIETFDPAGERAGQPPGDQLPGISLGGLLFQGNNSQVLRHLLERGLGGKIDLVYIDPPFSSGANYRRRVYLRGPAADRLRFPQFYLGQQMQYSDYWSDDEYLQFIYERLLLLRELLAETGSIYLHCDYRKSHHLRCLMDEVFGAERLQNEIIWFYPRGGDSEKQFNRKHDTILFYTKGERWIFNYQSMLIPYSQQQLDRFDQQDEGGRFYWNVNPRGERVKTYLRKGGIGQYDVWNIGINAPQIQRIGYPTLKPEPLLERIIRASSRPGDLVLDCFVGGGTSAVVAQRLGRRWIACDSNPLAVQTTSRRLIGLIGEQLRRGERQADEVSPQQRSFATYRLGDEVETGAREAALARVRVERINHRLRVVVDDFGSPAVSARLAGPVDLPGGWRALVDSIKIDTNYSGAPFKIALADVPERSSELVAGSYELEAPPGAAAVAVKIADVLGQETLVVVE
jgi:site-specific DNA-methyltransferase (adenine-specific)/adenine-specific DNA-methyltransferase